jgi:hypothetical protein
MAQFYSESGCLLNPLPHFVSGWDRTLNEKVLYRYSLYYKVPSPLWLLSGSETLCSLSVGLNSSRELNTEVVGLWSCRPNSYKTIIELIVPFLLYNYNRVDILAIGLKKLACLGEAGATSPSSAR